MDRQHHHGVSPYEDSYGFSRAVRVGDLIRVAGTAPVPDPGEESVSGAYEQMMRCVDIARRGVEALGGDLRDTVRTRMYIIDPADADDIGRAHRDAFGEARPASTMVVVAALLDPSWKVEIEVDVVVGPS